MKTFDLHLIVVVQWLHLLQFVMRWTLKRFQLKRNNFNSLPRIVIAQISSDSNEINTTTFNKKNSNWTIVYGDVWRRKKKQFNQHEIGSKNNNNNRKCVNAYEVKIDAELIHAIEGRKYKQIKKHIWKLCKVNHDVIKSVSFMCLLLFEEKKNMDLMQSKQMNQTQMQ